MTADSNGKFTGSFPASATASLQPGADTNYKLQLGLRGRCDLHRHDAVRRRRRCRRRPRAPGAGDGSAPVTLRAPAPTLELENSFVSSTGWVKPGERTRSASSSRTPPTSGKDNVAVTVPAPAGVVFQSARALQERRDRHGDAAGSLTWRLSSIASGTTATLVVDARAKRAGEDARIVWKDLSTTASLTYDGQASALKATSHGPKVIPPVGGFETARYGDKPFPVIPVDFRDRKHKAARNGEKLSTVINSPDYAGSTFNLYQEMSYGQLFPIGDVPSADIATRRSSTTAPASTSASATPTEADLPRRDRSATRPSLYGTPLYPDRINDGWYQLPGDTEYYGGDFPVFTATPSGIDAACGDTSKLVYDAVQIADPEIDYNDFDTDKDGVVDFVMVLFAGCGGNGGSQLGPVGCEDAAPYDNPWPHSSSLEGVVEGSGHGPAAATRRTTS